MITPDKVKELTRIAKDLFIEEYEKKYPDVCKQIEREIKLAAENGKTGVNGLCRGNPKETENLEKYLRRKGFKAKYSLYDGVWVGW